MTVQKKQAWGYLTVTLLALLLVIPAFAAGGPGGPRNEGKGGHGKITAISSTSITVTDREGNAKTFALTSATTATKDGQSAAVSDVTVGMFAEVSSTDGTTATGLNAHTGPPPGGPGGPPPGGQGGGPGGAGCPDGPPPGDQGPPPGQ